ncbi:hypothetical protein [[Phormidium] sp. ETS-05]|uniref:hypothetical protein n=1 Tax=[Phormidium] sp. ETS-05 TaxID=222819 RepID=UPI0018EEF821|nr:hypothetical protein [[Phormidium] sp. ETS-05]
MGDNQGSRGPGVSPSLPPRWRSQREALRRGSPLACPRVGEASAKRLGGGPPVTPPPSHPVTPSPRHPVTPSPHPPVTPSPRLLPPRHPIHPIHPILPILPSPFLGEGSGVRALGG